MSEQNVNQPQQPQPQQPAQPQYISQPQVYVQSSTPMDMMRAMAATRSYYGPALLTLALYWFTFWIGGVIANIIYLNSANNTQKLSGVSPEGKGCLWALLITHVILPLVGIGLIVAFSVLAAIIGGISGANR